MDRDAGERVEQTRPGMRHAIVRAARTLLEERGGEEALTLRGVARGAGITAPSVYNHFPDLAAVLRAVIEEAYDEYEAATSRASAGVDDPLERIRAGAHAYIRFAHRQPATYRLLFARHRPSAVPAVGARAALSHQVLVDAIRECVSWGHRPGGTDAAADALMFWATLHGLADLPSAHPRYPWPEQGELVERLLRRVVLRDARDEGV